MCLFPRACLLLCVPVFICSYFHFIHVWTARFPISQEIRTQISVEFLTYSKTYAYTKGHKRSGFVSHNSAGNVSDQSSIEMIALIKHITGNQSTVILILLVQAHTKEVN